MSARHCFDRHLGNASGNSEQQKRVLGNVLFADAQAAGKDWEQGLARFLPTLSDLDGLPYGSWLLTMTFTLARPFTSKTESEFHPYLQREVRRILEWFEIQNPIVRDHLTGQPLVKPTTWKGHLRYAARMEKIPEAIIRRLFGESPGDGGGKAGRLHFFPTFFSTDTTRGVVTPLKRSTRTPARGPIDIEVIPKASTGTFCLLYLPHPKGPVWSELEIADDLEAVAPALKAMFLDYGFSAKKTAGWGVVEDAVSNGSLRARGPRWPAVNDGASGPNRPPFTPPEGAFLPLMDEVGLPKSILRKPEGTWLSSNEFNSLAEKRPTSLNLYKRFRAWYDRHGAESRRRLASAEAMSAVPPQTYPVQSLTALGDLTAQLAKAIRAESTNE